MSVLFEKKIKQCYLNTVIGVYLDRSTLKQGTGVKMVASKLDFKVCLFFSWSFKRSLKLQQELVILVTASVVVHTNLGWGWGGRLCFNKGIF